MVGDKVAASKAAVGFPVGHCISLLGKGTAVVPRCLLQDFLSSFTPLVGGIQFVGTGSLNTRGVWLGYMAMDKELVTGELFLR